MWWLVVLATSLSLMGSMFTFSTYIIFDGLRTPSQTFALWLGVGSTGYGLLTFFRDAASEYHLICVITGVFETYMNQVAIFTTVVVADCMRRILISIPNHLQEYTVRIEIWHFILVWIVPMPLSLLPLITHSYGRGFHEESCWIENNYAGFLWMAGIFYLPFFISLLFNGWVYSTIYFQIQNWPVRNINLKMMLTLDFMCIFYRWTAQFALV
jgi:hypothetical protein